MARVRRDVAIELNSDQELELLIGPGRSRKSGRIESAFASDEARRGTWFAHRDQLIEDVHGKPWAQLRYEEGAEADNKAATDAERD